MIIRNTPSRDFSVVRNAPLESKTLSLKAKGLWAFLMTKPDHWQVTVAGLDSQLKEGRDAITAALQELKDAGLYRKTRSQKPDGQIEWDSEVYDKPFTENPSMDNPDMAKKAEKPVKEKPSTDNPAMENPLQVNTDIANTDEVKTDIDLLSGPSDPTTGEGEIIKTPKHPIGEDDERLAYLLRDLSLENYPHLERKLKEPTDANFRDIERLHRLDGLSYQQIEYMIKWIAHDEFWRQNIQSTDTLRKQKDKIIIRIKEGVQKRQLQSAEV